MKAHPERHDITIWTVCLEVKHPAISDRFKEEVVITSPEFTSFADALSFYSWSLTNPVVISSCLQVYASDGPWVTLLDWERAAEDGTKPGASTAYTQPAELLSDMVEFAKNVSKQDPAWDGQKIIQADPVEL